MRFLLLVVLFAFADCGPADDDECEVVVVVSEAPPKYEITCVHECGMTLTTGYFYPLTCAMERDLCVKFCAADAGN